MKVRCVSNLGTGLPLNYLDPKRGYTASIKLPLTIGKEYNVYAISYKNDCSWYYICDDADMYYPMRHAAPLFEIIDQRLSQYWRFNLSSNGLLTIAFAEWFDRPYFYDNLTDGEPAEVEIFAQVKQAIDLENEAMTNTNETITKLPEKADQAPPITAEKQLLQLC